MTQPEDDIKTLEHFLREKMTLTQKQAEMENLFTAGLTPFDVLEIRLSSKAQTNPFELAQRCANAFLTAFSIYPTTLAAHSTIAALFEASEHIIKAEHKGGHEVMVKLCGKGIQQLPLRIQIDDTLNTHTIAARWFMDEALVKEGLMEMLERRFGIKKQ